MKGIIEILPSFPSIKNNSNLRGGFTLQEYKRLVRGAKRMTLTDWYGKFSSTPDINWRCKAGGIFTGNQFVISEIALLICFMVNTFVRPVDIYERLKNISLQRGYAKASDYVFLPEIRNLEDAIYLISRDFRKILVETGLRYGRHGQDIDLLTLARNARTSVEMIERFYASELSAKMNIGMLHSRRMQKKYKNNLNN